MKSIRICSLACCFAIAIFSLTSSCKKDNNIPSNPTNGKSKAVFNSNLTYGTLTDVDGNEYKTIKIGTQTWMAENLRTTKYNDGTSIPNVIDTSVWKNMTSGGYRTYNNTKNFDTIATYGCLYNGYAATKSKLAPEGWHVPTNEEWITLENYLIANGYNYDGTKIDDKVAKSLCSRDLWEYSAKEGVPGKSDYNENINKSGFTAVPGGWYYSGTDQYLSIGFNAYFWSTSTNISIYSWLLDNSQEKIYNRYSNFAAGHSVR
jgi:uncharacterized protein (TIGR02145 family)